MLESTLDTTGGIELVPEEIIEFINPKDADTISSSDWISTGAKFPLAVM